MGYKDPEKNREYQRRWVASKMTDPIAREERLKKKRAWRERNKESIRLREAGYRAKKRSNNPKPKRDPVDPVIRHEYYKRRWLAITQDPEKYRVLLDKKKASNKIRMAKILADPVLRQAHYDKQRAWRQANIGHVREKNNEVEARRRAAKREKKASLGESKVFNGITKDQIDLKVHLSKRAVEARDKKRHRKRQAGREHMITCRHDQGFKDFEPSPLGGVKRTCRKCGKIFRQVGR